MRGHRIRSRSDQAALEAAAGRTEIYGGFVAETNTVVIAEAAGLVAPGQMPALYEEAAKAQGQKLALSVSGPTTTAAPTRLSAYSTSRLRKHASAASPRRREPPRARQTPSRPSSASRSPVCGFS
ncbi:hypothetical protein ACGFYY_35360 [Streptomyces sp. NPDC048331]|uniref:hypothetical protein n=1 Tax=Streptomyces sp. NPDC048331 TaxID=3365534 RepID=UPI0037198DA4